MQAIAKFGLPRVVAVQHATLREIDLYRRTERAAMVRSSVKALCRRRLVVDDVDLRQMKLRGTLHGRRRTFRAEAMSAEVRRVAVIEGDLGLEPMALFVGRGGRMLSKQRWEPGWSTCSGPAGQVRRSRSGPAPTGCMPAWTRSSQP
ncbi:hypothetical protein ACIGYR_37235 [Streptomyces sp. NPDC053076]|uniref:hypothetical protein n=1 Tax=Streptomyces sp. NPDC053076 TaxID=3365696 RepID=UPI0037D7A7DA